MSDARQADLPKRFYREAAVAEDPEGFLIHLDGRPVRTPGRRLLRLPTQVIAAAVAGEWSAQDTHIDPATMPVTRLSNTVLDAILDDPDSVRIDLRRYAETDLLFYRADAPERLVARQAEAWDPVLHWAEARLGALFRVAPGVMHVAQPAETIAAVGGWIERRADAFDVAALHQITTLTGSLLIAIAVFEGRLTADDAWTRAHVDEDWNIEQWGEDEEAAARRRARYADMTAAAILLTRS